MRSSFFTLGGHCIEPIKTEDDNKNKKIYHKKRREKKPDTKTSQADRNDGMARIFLCAAVYLSAG